MTVLNVCTKTKNSTRGGLLIKRYNENFQREVIQFFMGPASTTL